MRLPLLIGTLALASAVAWYVYPNWIAVNKDHGKYTVPSTVEPATLTIVAGPLQKIFGGNLYILTSGEANRLIGMLASADADDIGGGWKVGVVMEIVPLNSTTKLDVAIDTELERWAIRDKGEGAVTGMFRKELLSVTRVER